MASMTKNAAATSASNELGTAYLCGTLWASSTPRAKAGVVHALITTPAVA